MITPLTIEDLDYVIELVNARVSTSDSVLLPPECREPLASCLDTAFQNYAEWQLPQIERIAALMYWLIIHTRPLPDGNKRVAAVATALFAALNGYEPRWAPGDLYQAATVPATEYDGAHQIKEDLALLIFSNIRPLEQQDIYGASILSAA